MQSGIEMPAATIYLSTRRRNSAPIDQSAGHAEVVSRLYCDRHILASRVLMFASATRVPAHFELCGAARWVLQCNLTAAGGAAETNRRRDRNLCAREGGSF